MFELKEVKNPVEFEGDFQLFDWHGELLEKARVDKEELDGSFWLSISTFDKETSKRLVRLRLNDFENRIGNIRLLQIEKLESFDISIGFFRVRSKDSISNRFEIQFFLDTDLFNWKQFYGFSTYKKLLKYICEKERKESVLFSFDKPVAKFDRESSTSLEDENNEYQLNETIVISFISFDEQEEIDNLIKKYKKRLLELHEKVVEFLAEENIENTLISYFAFPEQIKTPCKQYLVYFAQFLRDLGINATSNIEEAAGKILFSITPTDDIEALDKIREALSIYLSLTSNPIPNSTGDATVDMVLSGARANAKYLESQLELAIAKLQFKEATLELKDATINQHQLTLHQKDETIKELRELISRGNIFEESLEKVQINGEVIDESSLYRFSREDDIEIGATMILDENKEETRVGLVKFHEVTKLKDYGVSLDLPKAIRNLIDYFKRDKNG